MEPKPSDSQDSHRAHHTKKDKIRHKIRALFKAFHIYKVQRSRQGGEAEAEDPVLRPRMVSIPPLELGSGRLVRANYTSLK